MIGSWVRQKFGRDFWVLAAIVVVMLVIFSRAFDIQILQHAFLSAEGNKRQIRVLSIPAPRGIILDRNGKLLALSTSVVDVWADPQYFNRHLDRLPQVAKLLGISPESLRLKALAYQNKRFMYLKRQVLPQVGEALEALDIPGVYVEERFKRYYPAGEVTAHLVGYTDIDDQGQDGIEYAYNDWLQGIAGKKQIIKDRAGRVIEFVKDVQPAKAGKPIQLSLDKDIQYFTYRTLKKALIEHQAQSAAAVVLDAKTGEVLAMASLPSFNPNDRSQLKGLALRNGVIGNVMEPGSVVKPFVIAKALDLGLIDLSSQIQTAPGYFKIEDHLIFDTRNHGQMTPADIIKFSSNVGVAKVALQMSAEQIWRLYSQLGFAQDIGLFLPGESLGYLKTWQVWGKVDQVSASYGYGFNINLLQLAQAYLLFANQGRLQPVSLFKKDSAEVEGEQLIRPDVVQAVLEMMEAVTDRDGTAPKAAIKGYRVAGKTGTVHQTKKLERGYEKNEYRSLFVGLVPASNPAFVMAVVVEKPSRGVYYGGLVAAPIFKEVMQEALRLRRVPYDAGTQKRVSFQQPQPEAAVTKE